MKGPHPGPLSKGLKRPHPGPLPQAGEGEELPPLPLAGEGRGKGVARAQALRRLSTPAERKLWQALRDRGVAGAKVRRQVAFGPWVLDFLFIEQRLVVEADGDTHAATAARDAHRAAWLAERGLRVLRFANREILGNIEGVLLVNSEALANPHPGPLPQAGEGRGEGADRGEGAP